MPLNGQSLPYESPTHIVWLSVDILSPTLISNCIPGNGRFYDPRTKQAFKYDHLRKEASDYQDVEADATAEPWRAALDLETLAYTASHYRHGVS